MNNEPTEYSDKPSIKPIQAAYTPYEHDIPHYSNPYENIGIPSIPPPPPKQKKSWLASILIFSVVILFISTVILLWLNILQRQSKQTTQLASTPLSTPTPSPTPTVHPGTLSKIPLLETDNQGNWVCYVESNAADNGTFAVLSNPNSSTLFGDCDTFMGQGNYYSTTPIKLIPGDKLQCEGWASDNTFWKVEAVYNDLPTILICHDLEQVVPGTQG